MKMDEMTSWFVPLAVSKLSHGQESYPMPSRILPGSKQLRHPVPPAEEVRFGGVLVGGLVNYNLLRRWNWMSEGEKTQRRLPRHFSLSQSKPDVRASMRLGTVFVFRELVGRRLLFCC